MGGIAGTRKLHTAHTVTLTGEQTQTSNKGGLRLALAGEIYNYAVLRSRLEDLGYVFETGTQAEVILNLYRQYGTSCITHISGMFVIALYDGESDRLYIWRDRYGVKPCFYAVTKDSFVFASSIREVKKMLAMPVSCQKESVAWQQYFTVHSPVGPETIYNGIMELEPAHLLTVSPAHTNAAASCKLQTTLQQYYELPRVDEALSKKQGQFREKQEQSIEYDVKCLIQQAVKERLPLGSDIDILLSGGVDSAYLAALAVEADVADVHTHTLQFICEKGREQELCDAVLAKKVADHLGTLHTTYTVTGQEALESLSQIAGAFDQPYSGGVSLFWLLQRVPEYANILMTGDGADEAFFGYPFHMQMYQVLHAQYASPEDKSRALKKLTNTLPGLDTGLWNMLLSDAMQERCAVTEYETVSSSRLMEDTDIVVQTVMDHYYKVLLPGQVFRYVDTLSGVFNRQIRCPYMDERVVNMAYAMPPEAKMQDGQTKYVLKQLAAEKLPAEVWNRKKETFLPPIARWMHAEWKEYVLDMLSTDRLERTGHFKGDMVAYLLARFYAEEDCAWMAEYIWTVLMFELWCDARNIK